jgi:protein-S-isoprenylcysteine O-methyltransferase Ste14
MKKDKRHLPLFGPGPVYVAVIFALTAAGLWLSYAGRLESGHVSALRIPFSILGVLLILSGAVLWVRAVFYAKIDANIRKNRLVTDGVYAWVRNPIYSAFLLLSAGALLFGCNLWLLLLPALSWAFLPGLMRRTEERWLNKAYGAAYAAYCRRTNRCIPRPPRQQSGGLDVQRRHRCHGT